MTPCEGAMPEQSDFDKLVELCLLANVGLTKDSATAVKSLLIS